MVSDVHTHTHTSHDHGPIQVPFIDGSKGCLKINEDEEPCYNQRKIQLQLPNALSNASLRNLK